MGTNCQIGDNVHLVSSSSLHIGDDCLFASKVFVSDTSHGAYMGRDSCSPKELPSRRQLVSNPVFIGDRVWLGENVVVLPGVSIGDGCIVGAGAVVSRSLPADCIAVGIPAKPIKFYNYDSNEWESIDD